MSNTRLERIMINTTKWNKYPFEVDGVKFVSLIDPNGEMSKKIKNLPDGVFTQMNQGAIRSMIGSVSNMSLDEIENELEKLNDGFNEAYLGVVR